MRFRVEVICVNDEGTEQRRDVMEMERQELATETLGLTLAEGKAILRGVQDFVASQQTVEYLDRQRNCTRLPSAVSQQGNGSQHRAHSIRAGRGAQSAVGALLVPDGRPEDLSAHGDLAQRTDESRTTLFGDEVGLADCL